MNKAEFSDLIKNPNMLGSEHIDTLKKIVADYPYFSTAHILLAKALLNTRHYEYEKQLKVTALSAGDRSVLHQFLNTNDLEIANENLDFNIPIELKVEKVSKPDFELGKEEQDALLNEAQKIILNTDFSNNINEITEVEITENKELTTENSYQLPNVIETLLVNKNDKEIEKDEFEKEVIDDKIAEFFAKIDENAPTIVANASESINEVKTQNIFNLHDVLSTSLSNDKETKKDKFEKEIIEDKTAEFFAEIDENSLILAGREPLITDETITKNTIGLVSVIEQEITIQNTINLSIEENKKQEPIKVVASENSYQLAETEGTLVRFKLDDSFLPDFDESSLFVDEIIIETITKSVLPIITSPKEIENISFKYVTEIIKEFKGEEPLIANNKNAASEIEIIKINQTFELINENLNELDAEILNEEIPNEKHEISSNVTLEDLLNNEIENNVFSKNNNLNTAPTNDFGVSEEPPLTEFSYIKSNAILNIENEDAKTENLIEENINNDAEGLAFTYLKNEETSKPLIVIENREVESHNFIEWLAANNKNEIRLVEFEIKANPFENYFLTEKDDFVEKINQILKTRAHFELDRNIANEIKLAHDGMPTFERKNTIQDILESEQEPIENNKKSIIENKNNIEDEVFDEIEAFTINKPTITEPNQTIINITGEETIEAQKSSSKNEFNNEIFIKNVESILPDFDALLNKVGIKEGEIVQKNIVEPTFIKQVKENLEETNYFEAAAINETDFNAIFEKAYKPTLAEKLPVKKEGEELILKVKNNTLDASKLAVESILDKFMRENPSITRPKSEFFNPASVAKQSVEEKDEIVSETLAIIYLKQGLIKKAILTYEKLSLIYPHKITYFAPLINQIKTEHNIN